MTTINETAEAVKAVVVLKEAVAKHDQLIRAIGDRLDLVQQQMAALKDSKVRLKR